MDSMGMRLAIAFLAISSVILHTPEASAEDRYGANPEAAQLNTQKLLDSPNAENQALKQLMQTPPSDTNEYKGKHIAILSTDGVEDLELNVPVKYFRDRGAIVDIISPKYQELDPSLGIRFPNERHTKIQTAEFMQPGHWVKFDRELDKANAKDYDGLILPGGAWNPDLLRTNSDALKLVKAFFAANKPVAAICHGPEILINADLLRGKRATSYWSIMKEVENAGATVLNQPVVVDGNLVTSRFPYDLPQFLRQFGNQVLGIQSGGGATTGVAAAATTH